MMALLAAHANTFHTCTFDEALAGIAEAGYTHLELSAVPGWTEHVDYADAPDAVAAKVASFGLTACALSGHSDLTTASGAAYAVRGIEWAAAYGLNLFTTAIGGHSSVAESKTAFLDNFSPVAEAAERHKVKVALEIHGELMGSGALARPLINEIGSEWVGVKYDTGNCEYYGGVKAQDDISMIADKVIGVDLKDHRGGVGVWDFPPPGEGSIDWPRVIREFSSYGFDGPYTVEIEFDGTWPGRAEITRALVAARRTLAPLVEGI
jgi:sugar phosphate isomerase/epimerase